MERRLAAILAIDMVGYSRLMGVDESGTITRQKRHREAFIDPQIARYAGRIVKTTGDGLLADFPSVVDAVDCALAFQSALVDEERETPEEMRILYRAGINLGDIVFDGEDILGDGVNVAARLEAISPPAGLCVSDVVRQNLRGAVGESFEDMGEQSLKNIERKVRVWRWPAGDQNQAIPSRNAVTLRGKSSPVSRPIRSVHDFSVWRTESKSRSSSRGSSASVSLNGDNFARCRISSEYALPIPLNTRGSVNARFSVCLSRRTAVPNSSRLASRTSSPPGSCAANPCSPFAR